MHARVGSVAEEAGGRATLPKYPLAHKTHAPCAGVVMVVPTGDANDDVPTGHGKHAVAVG